MQLSDFDFALPEELIALRPLKPRPASRLLVADGADLGAPMVDQHVADLPGLLRDGDLLILNDTKVIPARLKGQRRRQTPQGEAVAGVEITLISLRPSGDWMALAKPARKLAQGEMVEFAGGLEAQVLDRSEGEVELRFNRQGTALDDALQAQGEIPLPPYIGGRRKVDAQDSEDYQTVFARETGAVAAPTASLHFDNDLLQQLDAKGVSRKFVTLHVGAGTFLPVKTDRIEDHKMHAEWGVIGEDTAAAIRETRANGGRVIPVGTTALRLIETAAQSGTIAPWRGETDIFIRPGFSFNATDGLMTNFHLPKSTLMMLVSALMGRERITQIYAHAINARYRFFSYGDSSLLLPKGL
ncbi:tRNA preQ1(34) S-adenosylmethionine ribosyltransferase-isomerase QueA [Paracoccaceae bacterium GXU_MW_L88]